MVKSEFSKNLKILIKNLGITQKQFAEELNVNKNAVSAWITGKYLPNLNMLEKIYIFFKDKYKSEKGIFLVDYLISDDVKQLYIESKSIKSKYSCKLNELEEREEKLKYREQALKTNKENIVKSYQKLLSQFKEFKDYALDTLEFIKTLQEKYKIVSTDRLTCERLVKKVEELEKTIKNV